MTEEQERLLSEKVKEDLLYARLLAECWELEADYARIKQGLLPEDRDRLEQYITLCEEMEYRRTCIAMSLLET